MVTTAAPAPTLLERPRFLDRPTGIGLAILATVLAWLVSPLPPDILALLVVAALALIGLSRPVWLMAALLVSQFTITSYMVPTPIGVDVSLRLALLLVLGVTLWVRRERIEMGPTAKGLLLPAGILIGVATFSNMINSDFGFAFKDFRNIGSGILIVVFLAGVVKDRKDLRLLLGVALVCIGASAIVGVFQHFGFNGIGQGFIAPEALKFEDTGLRVPGMSETELELSYLLSTAIPLTAAICYLKGRQHGNWWLAVAVALPLAGALYFTYTRSALLAMLMGLVALVLLIIWRRAGAAIMAISLVFLLVVSVTGVLDSQYLGGRSEGGQAESSMSRRIVWQAGLAIVADNPVLGIGGDSFTMVSTDYQSSVDPRLLAWENDRYWGYSSLGSIGVHNDFLTVWVSYGTLALVAYLWMYFAIMRKATYAARASKNRFIKGLALGLAAALVVYATNAFFHNLFATIPLFWIIAGFTLASAKLAAQDENSNSTCST